MIQELFMEFGPDALKLSDDEMRFLARVSKPHTPVKRSVHRMLQVDIATGKITEIAVSENRWMRMFNQGKYADRFISVKFSLDEDDMPANIKALTDGIQPADYTFVKPSRHGAELDFSNWTLTGTYKLFLQSASQRRTCQAIFMRQDTADYEAEWAEAVKMVNYGYFPDKMNINKFLSYTALSQSSSVAVGEMEFKVMPDPVVNGRKVYDGGGLISRKAAKRIAQTLDLPYVPSAFQIRAGGIKGLVVAMDIDTDLILTESMVKLKHAQNRLPVEVCLYAKPQSKINPMTYQFINAINIGFEDLKELADREFDRLNGILSDVGKAMQYLAMASDDYDESLVSKVTIALDTNKALIHDPWVQNKLHTMMEKSILQMARGRIPVEGGFYFVFTDPTGLVGEPVLKSGEAYFNGLEGDAALFRTPLIHRSEASRVKLVNSPDVISKLGHIKNVIVLNQYDDTLIRAGGADIDGDKFFITQEPLIVNAVEGGEIIEAESSAAAPTDITWQAVVENVAANIRRSLIGTVTDMATTWADMYRSTGDSNYDDKVKILRQVQGLVIDSAKSGQIVEIPSSVYIKVRPHWLARPNAESYHSVSPMGKLYDYVMAKFEQWRKTPLPHVSDFAFSLLRIADMNVFKAVYPTVVEYLSGYKRELAGVHDAYEGDAATKMVSDIIEHYQTLMGDLVKWYGITVAIAAYYAAYNKNNISFQWVTCFDALMEAFACISQDNYTLVPIRLYAECGDSVTVKSNMVFDGKFVGYTKALDGEYQVRHIEDKAYVVVPHTPVILEGGQVWLVGIANADYTKLIGRQLTFKTIKRDTDICIAVVCNKCIGKVASDSLPIAASLETATITDVKQYKASVLLTVRA